MAIARVARVMIDVDELFAIRDARAHGAKTLETGAIGGDDAVKFLAAFGFLKKGIRIEEREFLRHAVFVPDGDFFALVFQREGEAELGADAIAIGPNVADDAKGLVLADFFENAVDDFRVTLH